VKEGYWSCCSIAATSGSLLENMLLGRKRLILLGTGVVARTGLFLSGITDTISIGNTSAPDSEVASSANQIDDSNSCNCHNYDNLANSAFRGG